ncbi:hypothetical protein SPRG_00045 [Saprolegnia parasitica CBS 223.65]|uniref:Uncharacterized protein n=1 Tax=Saprolegnia parasitica (strain CBS 223.65) TaxID=695850 RepID=A0A067CX05_SAPPC|nr:hypothetical protein SPRG_00045 [Saprolegnia parasitica CBS 223.65]KDO35199.1 hypothetical protein SPRG_00045 [Saprolegnia parasitica CBS 223.65]|eukprot:XP_012193551.1 hypothetical protein SPRG_00045 [Saprolegnia parasitica CBS 223.65]
MAISHATPPCHTSTVRVLDIQSDWDLHEADESFWVSAIDRPVLHDADPLRDSAAMAGATTGAPTPVYKDTNRAGPLYHIASQTPTRLTLMDMEGAKAMTFLSPTAEVGMDSQLFCARASADGAFLGVGGANGAFHATHVPTGQRIELKGHVGDVTTVDFFPSSRVALTGSADFRLRIWSMEAFRCAAVLQGHVGAVTGTGILGKGRNVVSCASDAQLSLWNVGTSERLSVWTLASPATSLCVWTNALLTTSRSARHPLESETDGKVVFVGTEAHGAQGIDLRALEPVLMLPSAAAVSATAMHPAREHTVLIGNDHGVVSTFDLRRPTSALTMVSRSDAAVHDLYTSNDGDVWAATGDGACTKWTDVATAPVVDTELFGPTYDAVHGVAGHGNTMYTVSRDRVLRTYTLD